MKSNILCVGCSHSHTGWGKSWPDFLSTSLNKNLIRASSPGAGNSFFIEKINHAIQHNDIDLVVVQLTEPSRVVTGFSFYENKNYPDFYNDPNKINDLACYTWNVCDNEKNFRSMLNKNTSIDHIWIPNVSLSKWTAYKVMQDIALIQYICFKFNIPVVFWSWFVPMEELFLPMYDWVKENIKYVPGCGQNWLNQNKVPCIPNDGHYNTEAHNSLVKNWLLPEIEKLI